MVGLAVHIRNRGLRLALKLTLFLYVGLYIVHSAPRISREFTVVFEQGYIKSMEASNDELTDEEIKILSTAPQSNMSWSQFVHQLDKLRILHIKKGRAKDRIVWANAVLHVNQRLDTEFERFQDYAYGAYLLAFSEAIDISRMSRSTEYLVHSINLSPYPTRLHLARNALAIRLWLNWTDSQRQLYCEALTIGQSVVASPHAGYAPLCAW